MAESKIPVKLIWQLLGKIFEDLDVDKLQRSLFTNLRVEPSSCYELLYGLILILLSSTESIHKSLKHGVSDNLFGVNLDKTISENTLRDCQVYSKTYSYNWLCLEHKVFLKALSICMDKSSDKFTSQKSINDYASNFCRDKRLQGFETDLDINKALSSLLVDYDNINDKLKDESILLRNEDVYFNLCRFSYLVLASESQSMDSTGSSSINYKKLDWYITQQYGIREVWSIINRQKHLKGKKHREFQPTIYTGNSPSLRPDAVYIFDDCATRDCIVDAKLYYASCLDTYNKYRFSNVVNQLLAYKMKYPHYILNHSNKSSRKDISFDDVNVWALHFRNGASRSEKLFSGTRLDMFDIGVFIVDMFDGCTIKDLDKQVENFTLKYVLKEI